MYPTTQPSIGRTHLTITRRVGLVVNPIAGMGGRVGLKGTDGADAVAEALRLGARPEAGVRTQLALRQMATLAPSVRIVAMDGVLGGDAVRSTGLEHEMLDAPPSGDRTSGDDTRAAVAMLREAGVDLIVFAGGDGTARDVLDVAGTAVPVLGIPAGVKMHSGVFATTPTHAGDLLGRIYGPRPSVIALRELEVMDVDERAYREGRVSATLYGYLLVPYERRLIQGSKRGRARSDDAATDAIATQVIEDLDDHTLYLFGGGTTTRRVFERLGIEKTLLGVDALVGRRPVGRDLAEHEILELLDQTESARVVVSVIGSQGYVLGRGNQQLSPAVLRRVGRDGLIVLATPAKLAGLAQQRLLADTGDVELDASLTGYIPVRTGVRTTTVMHLTS